MSRKARWNAGGPMAAALAALLMMATTGCAEDSIVVPERESYRKWIKVEPPGAVCGDGSQYKFFVNYSDKSNDLVVAFEPGGACWDYESCTGQSGIRGAANVSGLEDTHWEMAPFIIPFFQRLYEDTLTKDWNYVYIPYCTGDVHTGNNVITYSDPEGMGADVVFHHNGHNNVQKAIEWMAGEFTDVPKLLATGCSAGGAGSTVNYHWLRSGLPSVGRGYLLADSGPIFPSDGWSKPLHDKVYDAWNVESILSGLPSGFQSDNFGSINTMMADLYPDDRLAVTYFQRDMNFSLYSYERFYDHPPKEQVLSMWKDDTDKLTGLYDSRDNLAYYLPYWRALNDSHCTSLITFVGSEIEERNVGLDDFVHDLITDKKLESYRESVQPTEDVE